MKDQRKENAALARTGGRPVQSVQLTVAHTFWVSNPEGEKDTTNLPGSRLKLPVHRRGDSLSPSESPDQPEGS